MNVVSCKDGDIVDVNKKGRRFYALITGRIAGGNITKFAIRPLGRENYTTATAHEVVGIYRKAKGSA